MSFVITEYNVVICANLDAHGKKLINSARYAELGGQVECEVSLVSQNSVFHSILCILYCAFTSCTVLHGFVGHV